MTMDDVYRAIDSSPILRLQKEVILKHLSDPGTAEKKIFRIFGAENGKRHWIAL